MSTAAVLWGALVTPDRTLASVETYRTRRAVPLLLVVVLVLGGTVLALRFSQSPIMRDFATRQGLAQLDRMMANAPAEQREEARRRTIETIQKQSALVPLLGGVVFSLIAWLLTILQIWLLFILVPQFMGGEEQPLENRRHRRSQYLALYACIPVALQELLRGLVYSLMDPARLSNVATLADLQKASEVSFSLVFLAGATLRQLGDFPRSLLMNLTNPFVIWAGYILVWGGSSVLRVTKAKAALVAALVAVLFSAEAAALAGLARMFGGA